MGIRVAVIDEGVEDHEDLSGRVVPGYTPVNGGNGSPNGTGNPHGEACAGIIAATKDNNIGIAGICSDCIIVPVNIFYGGETVQNIADGINWAWYPSGGNADVLSCSFNGNYYDGITQAITNARTQGRSGNGSIVVFSAGNFSDQNNPVGYPANVSGVISVGAIDKSGTRWYYSPTSPSIVAPTGDLNYAGDVYTLDRMGANGNNSGNYMTVFGGTSAACPQVAGVAALMLRANPTLTENQVKTAILNNATNLGSSTSFGAGLLNAYAALSSTTPAISGTNTFCSSSTLTVSNVPSGYTVTWTASPTNVVSLSPSGNQVVATKTSSGYATITATVSNGTTSMTANYGVTTQSTFTSITATPSGSCSNGYQTWLLNSTPNMTPATNFHWYVSNPGSSVFIISSPNAQNTYVTVSGGGAVNVTYTDPCGNTSAVDGVTIYSGCGRGYAVKSYPNPANTLLTIVSNPDPQPAVPSGSEVAGTMDNSNLTYPIFEAQLFNAQGIVLASVKNTASTNAASINTSAIPNGTYYLHILQGTDKTEQQVIIQH